MKLILLLSLLFSVKPVKIEIIHTSNIAGNFGKSKATWINPDFPPTLGGFESLSELLARERQRCEKSGTLLLLMDAGNFTGGYITGDNLYVDSIAYYLNSLQYDYINIGVRELILFPEKSRNVDYLPQPATLFDYLAKIKAKFVSSNIIFSDPRYTSIVLPYDIVEYKGIKIGIFGLVSENTPSFMYLDIDPSKCDESIKILKEYESARKTVETLKAKGCDIVIMLSSIGYYRERFLARDVPGIDLILGGFDGFGERQAYVDPVNHTIILRNYDYLSQIGKIVLTIDPKAKTIVDYDYTAVTPFEEEFTPLAPAEAEGEE
jgi:2',3'-cyclic-nucleotide 2'-phosphodiesterase (5'-nucleotidase family)